MTLGTYYGRTRGYEVGYSCVIADSINLYLLTQSTAGKSTLGAHQTVFGDRINSLYCLANINAVCREAEEGLNINRQVYSEGFSSPNEKTISTKLNPDELKLISKYLGNQYLENGRDWLIVICWLGFRVGDLMTLSIENIKLFAGDKGVIQCTQSKTKKMVNIPIYDKVSGIID